MKKVILSTLLLLILSGCSSDTLSSPEITKASRFNSEEFIRQHRLLHNKGKTALVYQGHNEILIADLATGMPEIRIKSKDNVGFEIFLLMVLGFVAGVVVSIFIFVLTLKNSK